MGDRRRASRFVLPDAAESSLLLMQDVYVERANVSELVILSDKPVPPDEDLTLELSGDPHGRRAHVVYVSAETVPRAVPGERHRVLLQVIGRSAGDGLEVPLAPAPSIGVLTRRLGVRVRDISINGCLIETAQPLEEGAIGVLELAINGEHHAETLRVCRSMRVSGGARPCRAGARFLALHAPPSTSVRNVVARFELLDELGAMPEALARVHRRGTIAAASRDRFALSRRFAEPTASQ